MVERIEGMSIGLTLDSVEMERGLTGLKDKLKTANAEMKNSLSTFDRSERSVEKYTTVLDGLNKKIEIQERIVKSSKDELNKMTDEFGAGSKEAEKAKRSYENASATLNNLQRSADKTEKSMKEFTDETAKSESKLTKFSDSVDKSSKKLTDIGGKMKDIGGTMTAGITAPLLAGGGLLLKQAVDISSSQADIQGALGLTSEEAEKMHGVVMDVYNRGWGESLEHVQGAMVAVNEQLGELNDPEQLDNAITKSLQLEKTFDMDMNEALRGVNALMESYGMTSDEAFDLITAGAQNGLDKTDELGDNLAEYATLFEENGYHADEMFGILQAGLDGGAYSLDKVNDLVKEFGIRVGDGTIKTAVEEMGGSWQEIYDGWEKAGGTNAELFQLMAQNLASIEDPQEKQLALTEIWGSVGEDSGTKVVEAMGSVGDAYADVSYASDDLVEQTEEAFGVRLQSLIREFADAFLPLGETLLELAEKHLPKVEEWVGKVSDKLAGMSDESIESAVQFGGLALVAGPLVSTFGGLFSVLGSAGSVLSKVTGKIGGKGGLTAVLGGSKLGLTGVLGTSSTGLLGGLTTVGTFLTGPWGLAIAAAVAAGAGLTTYLRQDAFDATVDFGDQVSETTSQAVTDFMELNSGAQTELDLLFGSSTEITAEGTAELTRLFDEMHTTIKTSMDERFSQNTQTLHDFFAETRSMSDENESQILEDMRTHNSDKTAEMEAYEARYTEIMALADEENRALTEAEKADLDMINEAMKVNAIATLSESEEEQLIIMERLKNSSGVINAQQAADTVARSGEARDGAIADANTKYEEVIAAAIYERDQTGTISEEEAQDIIAAAGRQRDESVKSAEDKHKGVVDEAKLQAGEHVNEVDWETGEVLSKYETMKKDTIQKFWDMGSEIKRQWNDDSGVIQRTNDKIKNSFTNLVNSIADAFGLSRWSFQNKVADFINGGVLMVQDGVNSMIDSINKIFDALDSDFSIPRFTAPLASPNGNTYTRQRQGGVQSYAKGTDGHPGGPAIVGDGGMKELILFPNGKSMMSPDTDTLLDMPKGTQVVSGPDTKKMMSAFGIPKYEDGIGSKIWEWFGEGASGIVNNTLDFFGVSAPSPEGTFGNIASALYKQIKTRSIDMLKGQLDSFMSVFSGPAGPTGNVGNWQPMIMRAAAQMGQSVSGSEVNGILAQIQRESGGNQTIVQSPLVWDINTANGNPARGLLQYIPQTFAAYQVPGFGNIYDGYHQLLAFFNNTNWRYDLPYGTRGWGPTGGTKYATGGLVGHGLYELGEEGYPEFIIPTAPNRRTEAMKLLALAGKQVQGNKRPNDLPTPQTSEQSLQKGDTYHIHITANGDLPTSTIRRMADQFEEEIKKKQDRKRMSRGEGVSFG